MAGWLDRWRDATVAIGRTHEAGVKQRGGTIPKNPSFLVVGTGVIFSLRDDPTGTPWLVTAKHVFRDPLENWEPSELLVRFSWFDEKGIDEYPGIRIDLKRGGKRRWLSHPNKDVDLACLALRAASGRAGKDKLAGVTFEDLGTAEEIYQGAPVLVLGYPGAVGPSFGPRAMVRQGIVSWVSRTKPESSVFLIDSHVFPGNSGGPVFKLPSGMDCEGHYAPGGNVSFLGVVTQARIQKIPLTVGGKEVEIKFRGRKTPETLLAPSFMAIGLIEPALRVKELLGVAGRPEGKRQK